MNIIITLITKVAISLHRVNNPLASQVTRDPISPILFARISPVLLTRLVGIVFFFYAAYIFYEAYIEYILPIIDLGICNNFSHLPFFFYFRFFEACLYLVITIYCLIYRTKRTNKITLLFYYLMGKPKLKKDFLPKQVIYKQMSLFLIIFLLFPYLSWVILFLRDVWFLSLEGFQDISLIKKIRFILVLFTFLVVIWLCFMSEIEEKLRGLGEIPSDKLKDQQYLQAGSIRRITGILQLTASVATVATLFDLGYQKTIGDARREEETRQNMKRALQEALALANKDKEEYQDWSQDKVKMIAEIDRVAGHVDESGRLLDKIFNLQNMIKKEKTSSEDVKLSEMVRKQHETRAQHLEGDLYRAKDNLNLEWHKFKELRKNFEETFSSDINKKLINIEISSFSDLLKGLNFEQVFALTFFLLSNIILTNVMSIVFILFGDYLIKRYNLEEKYPKLAKWIQLRRRLQRYYLIMSIGLIIISALMIMGTTIGIFIMFS